jgi:hypothetical protein
VQHDAKILIILFRLLLLTDGPVYRPECGDLKPRNVPQHGGSGGHMNMAPAQSASVQKWMNLVCTFVGEAGQAAATQ